MPDGNVISQQDCRSSRDEIRSCIVRVTPRQPLQRKGVILVSVGGLEVTKNGKAVTRTAAVEKVKS